MLHFFLLNDDVARLENEWTLILSYITLHKLSKRMSARSYAKFLQVLPTT